VSEISKAFMSLDHNLSNFRQSIIVLESHYRLSQIEDSCKNNMESSQVLLALTSGHIAILKGSFSSLF